MEILQIVDRGKLSSAEVSDNAERHGTGCVRTRRPRCFCARGPVVSRSPAGVTDPSPVQLSSSSCTSPACNFLSSLFILHLTLTLTTADREARIAQFMVLHHVAEPASVTPLSLTARVMYFLCPLVLALRMMCALEVHGIHASHI